jgi:hypothetical protein
MIETEEGHMRARTLLKNRRIGDPFLERRSGDDRREAYDLDYFEQENVERRKIAERRHGNDRRAQCVKVSQWSSVCPDTKPPIAKRPQQR